MLNKELEIAWKKLLNTGIVDDPRIFLTDATYSFLYSKHYLKDRWPEEDEKIFYTDIKCACLYGIINNFPDTIHNYMLSKSLDTKSDYETRWVMTYFDSFNLFRIHFTYPGLDGITLAPHHPDRVYHIN